MFKKSLCFFIVTSGLFVGSLATAEGFSKAEMAAYLKGCKQALSQAKPNWNPKDIDMLCADPYLTGKPNESKADKARRLSLINKTNEDKNKMISTANSETKDFMNSCKEAYKVSDPAKDPEDVSFLCKNPYLTPVANESSEDQARRKRLIKESDEAKNKAMDKFVVPTQNSKSTGTAN